MADGYSTALFSHHQDKTTFPLIRLPGDDAIIPVNFVWWPQWFYPGLLL